MVYLSKRDQWSAKKLAGGLSVVLRVQVFGVVSSGTALAGYIIFSELTPGRPNPAELAGWTVPYPGEPNNV